MEISTFELLVKPIAPRITGNAAITAVARRVVQGYFLTISNLESKPLTYRLDFFQSTPNPPDPDRTLLNNVDLLIDIAGANTPIPLTQSGNRFSGSFRLPAKQTATVQLLPRLTPEVLTNPEPDLEIRGFVVLRLPALRKPGVPLSTEAQSAAPVKVLLNPEIRGTFLPNTFPASDSGDFDQINYPLAIATGKGLNEVKPDPGGPIIVGPVLSDVIESIDRIQVEPQFADADTLEKIQGLVELMSQLDASPENLQSVSDLLSKLEIPIQVTQG